MFRFSAGSYEGLCVGTHVGMLGGMRRLLYKVCTESCRGMCTGPYIGMCAGWYVGVGKELWVTVGDL